MKRTQRLGRRGASAACILLGALLAIAAHAAQEAPALLAQGRGDEAVRALEAQVGTNPFDPVSMNNLAAVKAARADWIGASALLVRAHRLAPGNVVINDNLRRLNDWLSQRLPPAGKASGAANPDASRDALSEIPPEPPALWSAVKASVAPAQPK